MMLRLAVGLIFIVVPMLELMLLIKIGQRIGVLATVTLVLATAVAGAMIISRQSLAVVSRTLEAVSAGRPPVEPVMDGLFLVAAGVLLLTPGLLTDVVAVALLVPPLRRAIARASMQWALRQADIRVRQHDDADSGPAAGARRGGRDDPFSSPGIGNGPVIDGEFERLDERPMPGRRPGNRPGGNGPRGRER